MQQPGTKFLKMRIPYVFMVATWLPVFLIVYFVPDVPTDHFYDSVEMIIDQHFFGTVGMWSSAFPLPSKIITNYVCIIAPFFAMLFTYLTFKKSTFERSSFSEYSLKKIIVLCVGWMVLIAFVLYNIYVGDTDLGNARRRFAVLGKYKIIYALFSAGILYLLYVMAVASYFALRFFPELIIYKYRAVK